MNIFSLFLHFGFAFMLCWKMTDRCCFQAFSWRLFLSVWQLDRCLDFWFTCSSVCFLEVCVSFALFVLFCRRACIGAGCLITICLFPLDKLSDMALAVSVFHLVSMLLKQRFNTAETLFHTYWNNVSCVLKQRRVCCFIKGSGRVCGHGSFF